MRIGAISSSNLYLRTNNDLKSDTKFYSNSIQSKDQVAFTMKCAFDPEEYKTIPKALRGEGNLFAEFNGEFKPFADIKNLLTEENANRMTKIIFMESEDFRQTPLADIGELIAKNNYLDHIICISRNIDDQENPLLFRIFHLPKYNRETLKNQIKEVNGRGLSLTLNLSDLLSKVKTSYSRKDFDVVEAKGDTYSLADKIYAGFNKVFNVKSRTENIEKGPTYKRAQRQAG